MPRFIDSFARSLLIALTYSLASCATTDDADPDLDPAHLITVADGVDVDMPDDYCAALAMLRSHDFLIQEYTASSAVAKKTYSPPIAVLRHPYQGGPHQPPWKPRRPLLRDSHRPPGRPPPVAAGPHLT